MGWGATADDKKAMSPRPLLIAALASLAVVPNAAGAVGLGSQRVVSQAKPVATASTMIAPLAACPGQEDLAAPASGQEQAMACMVDFARQQAGMSALVDTAALTESASDKSLDVLQCDSFSHFACGREFTYWMKETGYTSEPCWRVGENLAWGTGEYGSVRSIFTAWMHSPGHRANVLGDFEETGISLRVGSLEGRSGARVWAQHFGSHCG